MEGNSNQQPKEVTLNDLAAQMASGFERIDKEFKESRKHTEKLIGKAIEELATSTQKEFLSLKTDIEGVKTDIEGVKSDIEGVKTDIEGVKSDTGEIKANLNKKVDVVIHNELEYRVEKTEEKLGLKPKLKFA